MILMPLAFIVEVSVGGSYFLYFSDGVLALAFCFGFVKLIKFAITHHGFIR